MTIETHPNNSKLFQITWFHQTEEEPIFKAHGMLHGDLLVASYWE